jgi:hypothetical protein
MAEQKPLATEKGKEFALAEFKKRVENPPIHLNNSCLSAGSPMYFYCKSCGALADVLPESYTTPPKEQCNECKALKDCGWLEK